MSEPIDVTDQTFDQEVLQADRPVLVDYWAEWCGPCKAVAPVVAATADERGHQIKVAKLDVDANGETAQRFGIRGIPTLMLFKNGEIAATHTGSVSQTQLNAFIDPHL
jgi:thioredoxin 1